MMFRFLIPLFLVFNSFSQVVINEFSSKNTSNFFTGSSDWIELYNAGSSAVNLKHYGLTDRAGYADAWKFPSYSLGPGKFLSVLATGNSVEASIDHFESAITSDSLWSYVVGAPWITSDWNKPDFNDSSWAKSKLSVGYGDGDDSTELNPPIYSVYYRKTFHVADSTKLKRLFLNLDYDDGYVAYLNGVEISRVGLQTYPPSYDELAPDHEAQYYQGLTGDQVEIDTVFWYSLIRSGENVFAIEVHNNTITSSDLTLFAEVTFGIDGSDQQFNGQVSPRFVTPASFMFEVPFKLNESNETIYLYDASGSVQDLVTTQPVPFGFSQGRATDGGQSGMFFSLPTPNASNNASQAYSGIAEEPIFSQSGGVYDSTLTLVLSSTNVHTGKIYFTIDGNEPTLLSSLYSQPIVVFQTTAVRARFFPDSSSIAPSPIGNEIYMVNEGLHLPIVALSIDPADLYGANGIFDNWWTDWRKPCEVAYYDTLGVRQFAVKASVKPDGGAGGSRSNPQHSMTIEPGNQRFGQGEPVNYPLIPEKPYITSYDAFYLRNGSNLSNVYPHKDALMRRIVAGTNVNSQAYTPVNVFVNGEYFGVYELREKANDFYFKVNYNNPVDSLDLLSISYYYGMGVIRTVEGSDASFYSLRDSVVSINPADSSFYNRCNTLLDIDNFVDYIASENWFANSDWIYNNMKFARLKGVDNRWKFFLQDLEVGLAYWNDYTYNTFDYFRYNYQPNPFWDIYNGLAQNTQFRNYFINRYADLMNTRFQRSYIEPIAVKMTDELRPDIYRSFQKWSGDPANSTTTFDGYTAYFVDMMSMRNEFVRGQMLGEFGLVKPVDVTLEVYPKEAGTITISTITPESLPWKGVYFDGAPVKVVAHPNPGYTFLEWDTNPFIADSIKNQEDVVLNLSDSTTLRALFVGQAESIELALSELNFNPENTLDGGNWIEIYNKGNSTLDLSGYTLRSNDHWDVFKIPQGTKLAAKSYLVLTQDLASFKSVYPAVNAVIGNVKFAWENDLDSIVLLNTVGDTVLTFGYFGYELPLSADGWGRTVEFKLDSNQWFAGCVGGSPGEAFSPCADPIVFSEVSFNSMPSSTLAGDWVELVNTTAQPINLSGYVFKDSDDLHSYAFSNQEIAPGQHYVLARDLQRFDTRHPGVSRDDVSFNFGLGNSEFLRLFDNNGRLIQSAFYDTTSPWYKLPATEDFTLEFKVDSSFAGLLSSDWFVGCEGGSPAAAYSVCPSLHNAMNESGLMVQVSPNPFTNQIAVTFDNSSNASGLTSFVLRDVNGMILQQQAVHGIETIGELLFDCSRLAAGMYILEVLQQGKSAQVKVIKY